MLLTTEAVVFPSLPKKDDGHGHGGMPPMMPGQDY